MNYFKRECVPFIFPLLPVLALTISLLIFHSTNFELSFIIFLEITFFYFSIILLKDGFIRSSLWVLYCVVVAIQISSIINTGGYIIPLTLSNLSEFRAVGHSVQFQVGAIVLLYILATVPLFFLRGGLSFRRWYFCVFVFIFTPGPIHKFIFSGYEYYKQLTYKPNYNYPEVAKKYLKFDVYNRSDLSSFFPKGKPKNVIVIFTEGMSSKVIDKENGLGLNVTPNIDSYYKEGLVFENYFNHTAATFRGLRGQLSSAYQYKDGVDSKGEGFFQIKSEKISEIYDHRLISLPEILNANGFSTYFIASTETKSNLNALVSSMPFKKVYGMEDFDWHINDRMSDKKIFSALKTVVSAQSLKPFFIGMYSSGTHHGMDSPDEKYQKGTNPFYNKFYNYDFQLGEFVSWFKKSQYFDDTVLIITADHSTFPVPEFKKSFNTSTDFFVDTIPLVMIGGGIVPKIVNATGKNSLSLAPTILQILNINNSPNYFLGCSLFDLKCSSKFSNLSVIGDSYYRINLSSDSHYRADQIDSVPDVADFYNVSG
ncbi:LTA synthase family protein [Rahnella inusitata]|uniref:LTA synthase family protein n=1 Tax=Rahnella inusitata TaxID=58169 RepID=A0ABX9P4I0_9GAMM|nr:LTA synthase family protein [Rahnella inusitata]RJT14886.1 LTA synthase family protein [Rahnella inusitata]